MKRVGLVLLIWSLLGVTAGLAAQSLADRVAEVSDGRVRLSYAARPGICGSGSNTFSARRNESVDWEADCEGGPVRVVLTRIRGVTTSINWYVGGRWRTPTAATRDLGTLGALAAARYLIDVFGVHDDRIGRRALTAAGLADSDQLWPPVIDLARDADRSARSRRAAIEWLASSAGRRLGDETGEDDNPARRQAVFALSQLPREESIPRLVRIVESHDRPGVRRQALFWLGQTGDDRALPVIERILRTSGG